MAQEEEYVYMSCICTGYEEASRNDVLQISVRDDAGKLLFDSRIKPAKRKRWDSYGHDITPAGVRNAPTLSDVAPELQKLLRGKHVVLYNKKSLTRFLLPVLCTAATTHCCMLAYAEYKHDWDPYHKHYRWHKLDDAYFELSGQSGNINDCKLATLEIMTVWQQLMTNPKLRKKYGFIPFTEELLSWFKRIAVIFGVIVILFVAAILLFR